MGDSLKTLRGIVHLVPPVDGPSPGVMAAVERVCLGLARRGAQVTIATVSPDQSPTGLVAVRGFPRSPGLTGVSPSSQLHRWLRQAAGSGEVGILHSHSVDDMVGVYPAWISKWNWTPLVVSPHRGLDAIGGPFWRLVVRPALKHAVCFQVKSDAEHSVVRRLGFTQPVAVMPWADDGATAEQTSSALASLYRWIVSGMAESEAPTFVRLGTEGDTP